MSVQFNAHFPNPAYAPEAAPVSVTTKTYPKTDDRDPYVSVTIDLPDTKGRIVLFFNRPSDALDLGKAIYQAGVALTHEILETELALEETRPDPMYSGNPTSREVRFGNI